MRIVERRLPPFPLFAATSLCLHAALLGSASRHGGTTAAPTFENTAAGLIGDTLDVEPAPETEEADEAAPAESPVNDVGPAAPITTPPMHAGHGAHSGPPSAPAAPPPALFGAVGVRYATDLATTFTRAFPQAASADALWTTTPFGSAGTADVALALDDAGSLVSSSIGGAPSPALRRGIERTLILLGPRTFTARGALTRLRVSARVERNDVHDGLHGDVFALSGGSFSGAVGTAFFALPPSHGPGRRIDLELRLLP